MRMSLRRGVSIQRLSVARAATITTMALGLGITGVACGGGSSSSSSTSSSSSSTTAATTVSASQWVGEVCGTLTSWRSDLENKTNSFLAEVSRQSSDLQQVKASTLSFLNSAVQSTNNMISRLQAAGPAPTKDGQAVSQALVGGFQQIQVSFQQAQTQAQALPTDDPQALSTQLKAIGNSLTNAGNTVGNNIQSALNRYPTDNLDQEFTTNPACQSLK